MFGKRNSFSSVIINGKKIECVGNNITIRNNQVIIDGVEISSDIGSNAKVIVYGDVDKLDVSGSVEVTGNAGDIDCGGSCEIGGDVSGSVDAGGSVTCGNVAGDIDAGGSVKCRR